MGSVKAPRSLRALTATDFVTEIAEGNPTRKVTVGCLIAVASITGAKAQTPLAPVTVEAPVVRKKPAGDQSRLRSNYAFAPHCARRSAGKQAAQAKPARRNANAGAGRRRSLCRSGRALQSRPSGVAANSREPIVNTPKTITVLTKELLEDKDATSLKEVGRTTAGVTLGTGEGGNAFGDRFFIRGFDARNDVFVDGIRDPAVNIRENFFTEQIEILKGPSSTIDGRGTTGGALNIVTKQAEDRNFYNAESTLASDDTKRFTFDVNQVISPTLAIRMDGMGQDADVSERDFTTDKRDGLGGARQMDADQRSESHREFRPHLSVGTAGFRRALQ